MKKQIKSIGERFHDKWVGEPNTGCWLWTGARVGKGYGHMKAGRRSYGWLLAHRVAYELYRGPIPANRVIDHLCRTPSCVNPQHLEVVTNRENLLRGINPAAKHSRQTHCWRGHPFSVENTYISKNKYGRHCRMCKKNKERICD